MGGGEREAAFAPFLGQTALFMKISDQTVSSIFRLKLVVCFSKLGGWGVVGTPINLLWVCATEDSLKLWTSSRQDKETFIL